MSVNVARKRAVLGFQERADHYDITSERSTGLLCITDGIRLRSDEAVTDNVENCLSR